jgi:hypothetical protein
MEDLVEREFSGFLGQAQNSDNRVQGWPMLFVAQFPALSGRPACRTTARVSPNHDDQQPHAGSAWRVAAGHAGIESRLDTGIAHGVPVAGKALEDGRDSPVC